MHIATLVFSLLALMSFIAYHVSDKMTGPVSAKVASVSWYWVMPLSFVAAAFSAAF